MKVVLAILLLLIASPTLASTFCRKEPFDPDVPPGLEGRYEVIGKDPTTGTAYSGHLAITAGKTGYTVVRTIHGKTAKGQAWLESCGADNISFLVVEYATVPITKASCRIGTDGDNYYRATCRTGAGEKSWRGLEAWFQNPGLAP